MGTNDQACINTIRFLAVDGVEKAKSGHPGLPLGAAPMAYVLWDRFLRHNPENPKWFDRDRFVLSAGHGSMLLYSLLHLYGYDLTIEDLQSFRQWESRTPGHPEYGLTPGIEATTGPLGQGFAMGVGMGIAESFLAAAFNPPDGDCADKVVNHYTYAICSDGDLMEGVASEAASLAGHLKLGRLIYLYDDNHISIDGDTKLAFTEDVGGRFEAYGWHVQAVHDGNDLSAIEGAIRAAQSERERPSLICVRTHIGYGSPKQDSAAAHGEPLGPEAALATKEKLGWPKEPAFHIPADVRSHVHSAVERGRSLQAAWEKTFAGYRDRFPEKAQALSDLIAGKLPQDWEAEIPVYGVGEGAMATREASGRVLNALARCLPTLIGGSADLAPSNKTYLKNMRIFSVDSPEGRNFHFGVREHGMGGIINGMALHGGVIPYGGTFLVFSDYMRPAIRLSALMQVPSIFVFTHDSIALGEDGPTHQPIEHLMSLRAIPGLTVIRPADANETAAAWRVAVEGSGPVALALTRQKLAVLDAENIPIAEGVRRGAYILSEAESGKIDIILIGTGSEVSLVLEVKEALRDKGVDARVVSMPSWELFDGQPESYRKHVLPAGAPKLAVEAGSPRGWRDYLGENGDVIGLNRFGASAPGEVAMANLGFRVDRVIERAMELVHR
jgi:transketolase